jgi:hypothetical protein
LATWGAPWNPLCGKYWMFVHYIWYCHHHPLEGWTAVIQIMVTIPMIKDRTSGSAQLAHPHFSPGCPGWQMGPSVHYYKLLGHCLKVVPVEVKNSGNHWPHRHTKYTSRCYGLNPILSKCICWSINPYLCLVTWMS